jgi:hypothetical protein
VPASSASAAASAVASARPPVPAACGTATWQTSAVAAEAARKVGEYALHWLLAEGLSSPLFGPAMALGNPARPLLPASLKE